MYDKSLEQLIDAVIADGVITDQERKVVYKKAATLGIDQDQDEEKMVEIKCFINFNGMAKLLIITI